MKIKRDAVTAAPLLDNISIISIHPKIDRPLHPRASREVQRSRHIGRNWKMISVGDADR